jgi:hypothetical protein
MPTFNKFNCFVGNLAHALHDMQTGTAQVFKIYLSNVQPVVTNTIYGTPVDLSTANGYTAGGVSIGTVTGVQSAGIFSFSGSTNPTWTASGGSIGPFRFAVLYNSTTVSLPLIGWWDNGVSITLPSSSTFTASYVPPILTLG